MINTKMATKSVMILIMFSIGSKILGFFREILIAAKFGSGMETDTFFVAITATSLLTSLIGTAINITMIPILSEIESREGKIGKKKHTNNILNIMFLVSLLIIISGLILAPIIIRLIAVGFEGEQFKLAVLLMRIGLPVMLFSGTVAVFRGYLQSELMFTESAASNFPFNFVYIFFLLFLSSKFGIKGLMVTSVLAVAAQIVIQIPGIKKTKYEYKFIFDIKDKYVKKILHLVPPVLIGVAIIDINKVIDRALASNLVPGSISALNYASRLEGLILGVFISAITTVIFPMLSYEFNINNINGVKKVMGYGINVILLITIPATVGLIVLATPIVQIAFERGAFNAVDTIMTSKALVFYTIGLVAMALRILVTRVYYSFQDTKTPMINGAISVIFNIVLNLILIKFMAHSGLALATSIATTIAVLLMFYGLRRKIGSLEVSKYLKCGLRAGIASAIMGVVVRIIYCEMDKALTSGVMNNLMSLLVAICAGVAVYLLLCYFFGVEEVRMAVEKVKQKLMKS